MKGVFEIQFRKEKNKNQKNMSSHDNLECDVIAQLSSKLIH